MAAVCDRLASKQGWALIEHPYNVTVSDACCDLLPLAGGIQPADPDVPRGGFEDAAEHFNSGAFACAVGTKVGDRFPAPDGDGASGDGMNSFSFRSEEPGDGTADSRGFLGDRVGFVEVDRLDLERGVHEPVLR